MSSLLIDRNDVRSLTKTIAIPPSSGYTAIALAIFSVISVVAKVASIDFRPIVSTQSSLFAALMDPQEILGIRSKLGQSIPSHPSYRLIIYRLFMTRTR